MDGAATGQADGEGVVVADAVALHHRLAGGQHLLRQLVHRALDARDRAQIKEYVEKLLDQKITVGSATYDLKKVTVVFAEPEGSKKNSDYIAEKVSDELEFEIFNTRGERRTINQESLGKAGGEMQ